MKKKVLSVLYALMATVLLTTSALAGPAVKLSGATFSLGSLHADGTLIGLGNIDVTVELVAQGIPVITCTNKGANDVPGQSSPKIASTGRQTLPGNDPLRKNGKSPFGVVAENPELTWQLAGCPNANWSARTDFVFWTDARISVYNTLTGALLLQQDYLCTTTRFPPTVSCTPVP
jgi:hypothetical protein